ncbi:protein of unknown function (DUF4397) [Chitinophaga skermanii]|uniref:DUF4397 domain-containing protein n=1 Tax=Chitinophaga skermanii TaxID=331697 RepID=A0A327R372_9BACT|nr:DUF4397 domain-containing protein [Chitinophaga skermanii]RAJ10508.1 protein of unknown function (DUF4397) [Chitinophaga skermanii]
MRMRIGLLLLFLCSTLLFVSCTSDDDDDIDTGALVVMNTSPNSTPVDFFLDGRQVNTSPMAYPNNSGYFNAYAGQRLLQVNMGGR